MSPRWGWRLSWLRSFSHHPEDNREGVTVFLVEQNAWSAMEFSDRTYVLENGRIVREGKSKELLEDDNIRKAYLGL